MANQNAPRGFRALRDPYGADPVLNEYTVTASTTIYEGQVVAISTAGQIVAYTATTTDYNRAVGVAQHPRKGADTDRSLKVYDSPDQEFEVQVDDASVTALTDLVFRNFTGTTLSAGSSTLLHSTSQIDGSSGTNTNTTTAPRPFQGLRFSRDAENVQTTSYTKIVVKINRKNHIKTADTAGV